MRERTSCGSFEVGVRVGLGNACYRWRKTDSRFRVHPRWAASRYLLVLDDATSPIRTLLRSKRVGAHDPVRRHHSSLLSSLELTPCCGYGPQAAGQLCVMRRQPRYPVKVNSLRPRCTHKTSFPPMVFSGLQGFPRSSLVPAPTPFAFPKSARQPSLARRPNPLASIPFPLLPVVFSFLRDRPFPPCTKHDASHIKVCKARDGPMLVRATL